MKRSKIRNIIWDEILCGLFSHNPHIDRDICKVAADNVLAKIEEAGMLPPMDDAAYSDYYGDQSVGEGVHKYCEWEPEDEV